MLHLMLSLLSSFPLSIDGIYFLDFSQGPLDIIWNIIATPLSDKRFDRRDPVIMLGQNSGKQIIWTLDPPTIVSDFFHFTDLFLALGNKDGLFLLNYYIGPLNISWHVTRTLFSNKYF